MRLLLVEDHAELAVWVAKSLRQSGFVVDVIDRGDHAATALLTQGYDLAILDLSLPGMDGLEILQRIRHQERTAQLPVLILTARGTAEDRVRGLNLGADDYLPKPFELSELEARVRALLRRSHQQAPVVRLGPLAFDTTTRMVAVNERPLALTKRELAVLEALLARKGKPVTRDALFEKVFGFDDDAQPESIELYIHRLRKKLDGTGVAVTTLRGLGYLVSEEGAGAA
ncbi:response regulator [Propionivibrio dicarboxylicus]|uniref:Two-component system, OmpR family, response regulator TctD n=1 Tax=Propionivibrio dicarboxylicus TaxID=83767 RepID=A0A1G8DEP7_9RHOO|nr:response regulator [Propionivibrio dicarboxylicus]SDH56126.1 two-component system, OmpR family, response regulator TctD [Propionivibrio dicarboxylicus]